MIESNMYVDVATFKQPEYKMRWLECQTEKFSGFVITSGFVIPSGFSIPSTMS